MFQVVTYLFIPRYLPCQNIVNVYTTYLKKMTPIYETIREHFKVILSAIGNEFSDHFEPELGIHTPSKN